MDNDQLYQWACAQFKQFEGINVDKQEKYALIMAMTMQTRVLNGLSVWVQKNLKPVVVSHEG